MSLAEASENTARAVERRPCPQRPVWRGPAIGRTPSPWTIEPGASALPLTPGTTPRRRIAPGRGPTWRGSPPLPRPNSPARLQPGTLSEAGPTSPGSAGQRSPGGPRTPRPRKPGGTKSPRQAPPPGPPGLAPRAAPPRPARRAIRPEAQSSRRRGRRGGPRAGRRGA